MLNSSLLHWFLSTPPAWLVACVIGLVPIELWAGVRRGRRPDPIETRTSITIGAVYFAVKIVAGHLVFFSLARVVAQRWGVFNWSSAPWAWVGTYLLGDFVYYWVHRAEHRVRLLWASHQVHHSSTDFNFAAAVRMPWTEVWFTPLTGLWAPLLGVPPLVAATLGIVGLMWGLVSHTSLVSSMGVFDLVLVTPTNHRVHHASNPGYLDCNFGGGLIVWDRLFGTYVPETETPTFGLTHDSPSRGPLAIGVGGHPDLWRDLMAAAPSDRLAVALGRP